MEIKTDKNGAELTVHLSGNLDTSTAPELQAVLDKQLGGVEHLVLDFADLRYISSAGLRVLLAAMNVMDRQGTLVVRNVRDFVREIFEDTGLADDLTLE